MSKQADDKPREIEAKFNASIPTFRAIEKLETIAGWRVVDRRTVRLRDEYWDTPDHKLGRNQCTLRVREIDGHPEGELTFKGKPEDGGRTEEIATVRSGTGPQDWVRQRKAKPIVDSLRAMGVLDSLEQDVVLLNPRRELVLRKGGAEEVLSLDEVRVEDYSYVRRYVELELKHGTRADHNTLARALAARFQLEASKSGKVQAARDWLTRLRNRRVKR